MNLHDFLEDCASPLNTPQALGQCLRHMVEAGLDQLPLPGSGLTLQRWQQLALVAGHDLGLCKVYEGHTDALATLRELGARPVPPGSTWGLWAAEPPNARVHLREVNGHWQISGRKAWCSGAGVVSHGLLTVWDEQGGQQLVAVDMQQPGVSVSSEGWEAVGMAATASVDILFEQVPCTRVGQPGDYLHRPGFWQAPSALPRAGMARRTGWASPCNNTLPNAPNPMHWRIWARCRRRCSGHATPLSCAQGSWTKRPPPTVRHWPGKPGRRSKTLPNRCFATSAAHWGPGRFAKTRTLLA